MNEPQMVPVTRRELDVLMLIVSHVERFNKRVVTDLKIERLRGRGFVGDLVIDGMVFGPVSGRSA